MIHKPSIISLLDKEFIKKEGIEKIIPEKDLCSKKNKIYKIKCIFDPERKTGPAYFVFKLYREEGWERRKEKEHLMLKALKKYTFESSISVPDVFYRGKDFLITEFVEGNTLLDYILMKEASNEEIEFNRLNPLTVSCEIIKNFHDISREIIGHFCILNDINLRNFIIGSRLYRVDFEEWTEGCVEEDFGKFIAFILTYDPVFSDWKIKITQKLIKYIYDFFYIDRSKLKTEINKGFQSIKRRRNLHPGIFNQKKINDILGQ